MTVVNNLKDIREQHHWNQEQLASFIGTNRESIGRYERGERNPSLETALRLSARLNVTVNELFQLNDDSFSWIHEQDCT